MIATYRVGSTRRDVKVYLAQEFQKLEDADGANHNAVKAAIEDVLAASHDADLVIISETPRVVADDLLYRFRQCASERRQFIVVGRGTGTYEGKTANQVAVYGPDGVERLQDKLSLSAVDREHTPPVVPGDELVVHESGHLRFVVLNCHDYTHASLVHDLVELEVDLVIVISANTATQMFIEYAKADVHRLFAYVIICNVAELGGSGVYAPFQSRSDGAPVVGESPGALSMGGVQFEARGRARARSEVELAVPALRELRERYRRFDPDDPKAVNALPSVYRAIVPPESVTYSRPHFRQVLRSSSAIQDISRCDPRRTSREDAGVWNVAVAQLRSAGMNAYLENRYVVSKSTDGAALAHDLASLLGSTPEVPRSQRSYIPSDLSSCDLLVFPEVYLPVHAVVEGDTLDVHLQRFADRHGTIIVGGIEYDPQPHSGANRVRIYWPRHAARDYVKLTRSQYDAREVPGPGERLGAPFELKRGDQLVRFDAGGHLTFGVLTCFDYSHIELVHALNTRGRPLRGEPASIGGAPLSEGPTPLDLMIVPCFNPFGALYAEMARSDAHRYYQYVIVCNVSEHGESGIFGPERATRPRRTLIHAGKGVATVLNVMLPIEQLRIARDQVPDKQLAAGPGSHANGRFHRKPGLLTDGERQRR